MKTYMESKIGTNKLRSIDIMGPLMGYLKDAFEERIHIINLVESIV